MGIRKKVTWNSGQRPERHTRPRLPAYQPEPDIVDPDLKASWADVNVGQMCVASSPMFASSRYHNESAYPHPILYAGLGGWQGEVQIEKGQVLIYVGQTHVNCIGSKNRIISKPFHTVFFNGTKLLIADPNNLKPISE